MCKTYERQDKVSGNSQDLWISSCWLVQVHHNKDLMTHSVNFLSVE